MVMLYNESIKITRMKFETIIFDIHKMSYRNCMYDASLSFVDKYELIIQDIINSSMYIETKYNLLNKVYALKCGASDELYNKLLNVENKYGKKLNKIGQKVQIWERQRQERKQFPQKIRR